MTYSSPGLKFDIEFSEWAAIEAMVREGCLGQVKQLDLEAHSWGDTVPHYHYLWKQLNGLQNAGFEKYRTDYLEWRCFTPNEPNAKRRCPQINLNYFNVDYIMNDKFNFKIDLTWGEQIAIKLK